MENFDDVVLTTRIRLARDVKGKNFPNNMNNEQKKEILNLVKDKFGEDYTFIAFDDMDEVTRRALFETHKISKEMLNLENSGLLLDEKNKIITMINEEDHFRIQVFEKGFNIDKAYEEISSFDTTLSSKIKYAYSKDYGYITACPTCIGTGMRVSVMLHLPALNRVGALEKIFSEITNLGISVRGMYGENTQGYGSIFQISNQKTIGIKEEDIIEQVKQVTKYIVMQERKARKLLSNRLEVKDDVMRSYGILKNAVLISKKEATELLSNVRLGINMDIITDIKIDTVDDLIENVGRNALRKKLKENFSLENEQEKRASYIKENI